MSKKVFIFGFLVAVLLVIGLYRAKDGARESGADIARLEAEISEAYRRKALLEADLAHMSRREWIEEYARKELGMAPARASQFATEYNLDLLVGRAEALAPEDALTIFDLEKVANDKSGNRVSSPTKSVNVPVSDASNPDTKEDAEQ